MPIKIKKQSALRTQIFVLKALLKREMVTRFGKYKLGVAWMFLDPLINIIILGLVMGPLIGRTTDPVPYGFFLLCGFTLLHMVTGPINIGIGAIAANQGLLVFRQLQPIDPFLARFIFELLSKSLAFTLFCIVGGWLGVPFSVEFVFEIVACILIAWLMGCGIGLYLGIMCLKYQELEKVQQYLQHPLMYVSAVFYSLNSIPGEYHKFLLWNPIIHFTEYSRTCLFPDYHTGEVNLVYPGIVALICVAGGLLTYKKHRHFLTQR